MRAMNKIIMTLVGLLLIVAAGLKFYEMIDTCVPSWDVKVQAVTTAAQKAGEQIPTWKANVLGFWESYEFFLIQIPLEFALGIWLVSGLFRKAAWIVGTLAYFGFIFATLSKLLTGAESCGCFGQVHVDPKITLFAIDIPFFLLLAIFRPKGYKLLPPPWPKAGYMLTVAIPVLAVMALAAPAMVTLRPECIKVEDTQPDESAQLKLQIYKLKQEQQKQIQQTEELSETIKGQEQLLKRQDLEIKSLHERLLASQQTSEQSSIEANETAITPPDTTEQKTKNSSEESNQQTSENASFPTAVKWDWLQYVVENDVREEITQGLVIVMMHRFDCPVCEVMAPKYSEYYQQMVDQGNNDFKIAFLAIPPYGEEDHVPDDTLCIQGKLTDQRKWELMSPYVVALLDGELIKTWEQGTAPEPEDFLTEIFGE